MSFVTAAPEEVRAAAQNLAGIRSLLAQASASVAAPTTGVAAAAQDEVSAGVAAFFGAFGQEYQVLSAQTQAFHEQFVNLLSADAGAYLSTEVVNAEQALTSAVNAPVQGLLGGSATAGAAATSNAVAAAGRSIGGPYESLVNNTVANLQGIGNTLVNVTVPAQLRGITTQTNQIVTALQSGNPLPILILPGRITQGYADLIQALTAPVSLSITSLNPPNASLAIGLGRPQLLAFDALGAPVNAALAASASGRAFSDAVQTGNPLGAFAALVDAPANIANAFLNGEQTMPLTLSVQGRSLSADVPFAGLLVPLRPFATTATLPSNSPFQTVTITGPPVGGLVPALLE